MTRTGCGVFDEWRPDLMGTCRPDYASNVQERDISVTTPYGRIRGFYVHLFDGPGVPIGDRPGVYHNGKLWRRISTFLGIPYATPPVNEGRFKVTITTLIHDARNSFSGNTLHFFWRPNFSFYSHRDRKEPGVFGTPSISVQLVLNPFNTSVLPKVSVT